MHLDTCINVMKIVHAPIALINDAEQHRNKLHFRISDLQIWGVWSHPPPSLCSARHSSPPSLQRTSSPCNHRDGNICSQEAQGAAPTAHSRQHSNPGKGLRSMTAKKHDIVWRQTLVLLDVPGEPHSGEVTPAQFPDHMVFPIVKVPDFHMVVAPCKRPEKVDWTDD